MAHNVLRSAIIPAAVLKCIFFFGCEEAQHELVQETTTVKLGDKEFTLHHYESDDAGLRLINLHEDEQTSIEASLEYLQDNPGSLTYLHHDETRRIEFTIDRDTFSVDPNRIFTSRGIRMTLEDGGLYSESANEEVRTLAETILAEYGFDQHRVVVAMHNNGLNGYSIESYTEDGYLSDDAELVHIEDGVDINDFYYLTDRRFYDYLTERGYNAMLQDEDNVTNDGSLSVFSGMEGKPYINIEAGHGHLEKQIEMILAVEEMLIELDLMP